MPKFFTYITRCSDQSLYTGITNDLTDREKRHNLGIACNYTKTRRPVTMAYFEEFNTRAEAAKRERQIKGWTRKKKENLIKFGHPNPKKNKR